MPGPDLPFPWSYLTISISLLMYDFEEENKKKEEEKRSNVMTDRMMSAIANLSTLMQTVYMEYVTSEDKKKLTFSNILVDFIIIAISLRGK